MDTTPEEEANPVLVAFQKITTQLKQLEERDIRAEERERTALERERALIFQYNQSRGALLGIEERANKIQQNIVDEGVRNKKYLDDYFKQLPQSATVVHRTEWGFAPDGRTFFFILAFATMIAGFGSYYFASLSYKETLIYQRKLIREYEGNIEYLQSKIPVVPAKKKKRRN